MFPRVLEYKKGGNITKSDITEFRVCTVYGI